jgi:hypothetical protein
VEIYVSGHSPCPACGNRWARLILWPGSPPLLDCQACRSHFPARLQVAMPPTYPGGESDWRDLPWVAEERGG